MKVRIFLLYYGHNATNTENRFASSHPFLPVFDAITLIRSQLKKTFAQRDAVEKALRESEAKYKELVVNANSAIIRWDRQGCITFFNEFAEETFGYKKVDIIGKPMIGTIVHEENATKVDIMDIYTKPNKYIFMVKKV